jgi:hypothetical protein
MRGAGAATAGAHLLQDQVHRGARHRGWHQRVAGGLPIRLRLRGSCGSAGDLRNEGLLLLYQLDLDFAEASPPHVWTLAPRTPAQAPCLEKTCGPPSLPLPSNRAVRKFSQPILRSKAPARPCGPHRGAGGHPPPPSRPSSSSPWRIYTKALQMRRHCSGRLHQWGGRNVITHSKARLHQRRAASCHSQGWAGVRPWHTCPSPSNTREARQRRPHMRRHRLRRRVPPNKRGVRERERPDR